MEIKTYRSDRGKGIYTVQAFIDTMELTASVKTKQMLEHILSSICQEIVKEYLVDHREEIKAMITKEFILEVLHEKIKDGIRIG